MVDSPVSATENYATKVWRLATVSSWGSVHGWGAKCGGRSYGLYAMEMYRGRPGLHAPAH